jgi:hypothetical protein
MASWDLLGKALVRAFPQDFVDQFLPGAQFIGFRECQLQTRVDGPFKAREIRADVVLEGDYHGKRSLLDVEWQSTKDEKIPRRLIGYNHEGNRLYGLPMRGVVIYMQEVSNAPQSPYVEIIPCDPLPEGNEGIRFNYASCEVCAQTCAEMRVINRDAFYVLMALCQDGGTTVVLDEVLDWLLWRKQEAEKKRREAYDTAIIIAFYYANEVLASEKDRTYMEKRRQEMLKGDLKDNWLYREMFEEAHTEGRLEGIQMGQMKEARQNIANLVTEQFPGLLAWAEAQVEQIADLATLRSILRVVARATTEDEIKAAFPAQS